MDQLKGGPGKIQIGCDRTPRLLKVMAYVISQDGSIKPAALSGVCHKDKLHEEARQVVIAGTDSFASQVIVLSPCGEAKVSPAPTPLSLLRHGIPTFESAAVCFYHPDDQLRWFTRGFGDVCAYLGSNAFQPGANNLIGVEVLAKPFGRFSGDDNAIGDESIYISATKVSTVEIEAVMVNGEVKMNYRIRPVREIHT